MRALVFITSLIFSFQAFSQSPDLIRTWYLSYLESSDNSEVYNISEINPPIQPFIEIFEDFTLSGLGACNTFTGTISFPPPYPDILEVPDLSSTNTDCGFQIHNDFEDEFFSSIQTGGDYLITSDNDGLTLIINTPAFGVIVFKDSPLGINSFNYKNVIVYPNPFTTHLIIDAPGMNLNHTEIFTASGKKIFESPYIGLQLDLSYLNPGIYFLKLESEGNYQVKKILKR